jgi:predicted ferric reductase
MFVDILNGIRNAVFTIIMIPFLIVGFAILVVLSIIYVLFGYVSVKKFWAWCKSGVNHMVESGDDYLEF